MFGLFKSEKDKALELFQHNYNIIQERNKKFHYSLNPHLILEYLSEQVRFLYSCQGLKNYFTNNVAKHNDSLRLESLVFIASIAENKLQNIHYDFFDVGFLIDHIIKDTYGGGNIRSYHLDVTREFIHEQIYTKRYGKQNFTTSLEEFLIKAKSITQNNSWNYNINSRCAQYFEKFNSFLSENHEKIIEISNTIDKSDNRKFKRNESKYIDSTHKNSKYKPNFFPYGLVTNINDVVDRHLLKRLNINLDELDLDYYRNSLPTFFRSSFIKDPSMGIFRYIVEQAYITKDGKYQKSELKLVSNNKKITGVEISTILNEIIHAKNMKSHIQYVF